jgi:hypothetical protein
MKINNWKTQNLSASELRLNNYVFDGGEVVMLKDNYTLFKALVDLDRGKRIKPIPLTEEWLLNFGFKNNRLGLFDCFKEVEYIGFRIYFIKKHLREVQYVNQLQNLYFVLMGTELIIKE